MVFRVFFATAASYNLDIYQMNIKAAFLYDLINQLIYVKMPKSIETSAIWNIIYKLQKALYGLKQSSGLWYKQLSSFLREKLGFRRINTNHSIFITFAGLNGPIISAFVDDIKIMAIKEADSLEKSRPNWLQLFRWLT